MKKTESMIYAETLGRELFTPPHGDQCPILPDGYRTSKICPVDRTPEEVEAPELDDGRDWAAWMEAEGNFLNK